MDQMTNEHIVVVVQLEYPQGTHGGPRQDGPPIPNHIRGMLMRYKDVLTNRLLKNINTKEWITTLLTERLSSWAMWWPMKLVDEHDEGQGNLREEVTLDS